MTTSNLQAGIAVMPRASADALKWAGLVLGTLVFAALLLVAFSILPMIALWRFGLNTAEFWSTSLVTTAMSLLAVLSSRHCRVAWETWKDAERNLRHELHHSMLVMRSHIQRPPALAHSRSEAAPPPR
jgi:hypothetical protein